MFCDYTPPTRGIHLTGTACQAHAQTSDAVAKAMWDSGLAVCAVAQTLAGYAEARTVTSYCEESGPYFASRLMQHSQATEHDSTARDIVDYGAHAAKLLGPCLAERSLRTRPGTRATSVDDAPGQSPLIGTTESAATRKPRGSRLDGGSCSHNTAASLLSASGEAGGLVSTPPGK